MKIWAVKTLIGINVAYVKITNDLPSTKMGRRTFEKQPTLFKNAGAMLPDCFSGFRESVVSCKYLKDNTTSYYKKIL